MKNGFLAQLLYAICGLYFIVAIGVVLSAAVFDYEFHPAVPAITLLGTPLAVWYMKRYMYYADHSDETNKGAS